MSTPQGPDNDGGNALVAFDLVPARMINEWVYCPRLAYLEWVDGEWADSADTEDGRRVHRRVDQGSQAPVPGPDEIPASTEKVARSLWLSAPKEGITTRIDLVELEGNRARPVDYKRGNTPDVPERSRAPEQAQVVAQLLALQENGWETSEGVLYFAASGERVPVWPTQALVDTVRDAVHGLREAALSQRRPAPLEDSPKCWGCSLAPICLPDELHALRAGIGADGRPEPAFDAALMGEPSRAAMPTEAPTEATTEATDEEETPPEEEEGAIRLLFPPRDEGLPMHVIAQGASVGKTGEELVVKLKGQEVGRARLPGTSSLSVYGGVQVTTGAMRELMGRGISVHFHSMGGWHYGHAMGHAQVGLAVRRAQFRRADDPAAKLALARRFVRAKVANQRTLLRRNAEPAPEARLTELKRVLRLVDGAESFEVLLGLEGEAAAAYFGEFSAMLRPRDAAPGAFDWTQRNRRPPRDPVNAVLSFGYALLMGVCRTALMKAGLDPMLGFYHTDRPGRPALALDFMEEYRPLLADSVVLTLINTGELRDGHFVSRAGAVNLTDDGRRRVLLAWEHRLDGLVTHPIFGYRLSYRKLLEVQARLLARFLLGEIDAYPEIRVR